MEENIETNHRIFNIPVYWVVKGFVPIEALNLEEALETFDKEESEGNGYSLPSETDYLDGSFERGDEEECYLHNYD